MSSPDISRRAIGTSLFLLAVACASGSGPQTAPKKEPEISVERLSVNSAQPASAVSIPMIVRVRVTNRTDESVTVDRMEVSSVGTGPYTIASTTKDFNHVVQPGHVSVFPVWAVAVPTGEGDIGGRQGQMVMRAVVFLTSPSAGAYRKTVVDRVEATSGGQ